jgi:hypothetical protein
VRTLLTYLPAIACLAILLVVCLPMLMKRDGHDSDEVAQLREEVARLRTELAVRDAPVSIDG